MRAIGLIVRAHHERWDGSGYPDGLRGEQIPLEARIVAACDAFNAMTTNRSYRRGMPRHEAVAETKRCSGTHFDPTVVEALLAVLPADAGIAAASSESHGVPIAEPTLEPESEFAAALAATSVLPPAGAAEPIRAAGGKRPLVTRGRRRALSAPRV
jgi:HD domain